MACVNFLSHAFCLKWFLMLAGDSLKLHYNPFGVAYTIFLKTHTYFRCDVLFLLFYEGSCEFFFVKFTIPYFLLCFTLLFYTGMHFSVFPYFLERI
jgi:hypothetical protein